MRRRRADILFKSAKVAVLVDGCFWHGCPQHGVLPNANREWWQQKLQENRARDAETDRFLEAQGFLVFRVWEHEDPAVIAEGIEKAVRRRWHRLQVSDTRRADAE
jgi:DNA mismatch endonuclease (patch repair protein)